MAEGDHPGDGAARARPRARRAGRNDPEGPRADSVSSAGSSPTRLRPRVRQARRMGALLPRPKAICLECGTVSIYSQHINRRCARLFEIEGEEDPVPCEGHFSSAVAPDNWIVCPDCGATGFRDNAPCTRCSATGWRYVSGDTPR